VATAMVGRRNCSSSLAADARTDSSRAVLLVVDRSRRATCADRRETRAARPRRYRARSGSALSAISIGVLIAVIVILASASRFSNVLDYAGPNLASNQLALHTGFPPQGGVVVHRNGKGQLVRCRIPRRRPRPRRNSRSARPDCKGLDAQLIALESPNANLSGRQGGRSWSGQIYVATAAVAARVRDQRVRDRPEGGRLDVSSWPLRCLGSQYGFLECETGARAKQPGGGIRNPLIQEISALPSGTSAPNTVITEYAMKKFHISEDTTDWLVVGNQSFTAAQISSAQLTASTAQLQVESRNDIPSGSTIINYATLFGILIALGVLAMSVGLVRSETSGERRTLAATGASSYTRRTLTAVTAGALGFLGALLGVVGGYVAMIGC